MEAVLTSKAVLVIVTLLGMALCSVGIGQVAMRHAWLEPLSVLGMLLGVVILTVVGAGLFGYRLPWVDSPRSATFVVVALMIAKVMLTQLHRLAW
jgi:hypothetical protein